MNRQILLAAIETAADLKIKDAVPGLIKLLDSKDPQLVLRTIGSLGRLGDQRALPALGSWGVTNPGGLAQRCRRLPILVEMTR